MNWWIVAHNYVGVSTDELICLVQYIDDSVWMQFDETWKEWAELTVDAIGCELKKREGMKIQEEATTSRPVIETLKARLGPEGIVEVVSWYAEVMRHKGRCNFRCPFGKDENPSGVIYTEQGSWWCFRCNHGGDAIDAITILGRKSVGEAISTLGKHLGIDTRPKSRKVGGYAL